MPAREVQPTNSSCDRGQVLMLMPAAVLVVIILGAVAVDLSVVYLAERDLSSAAAAAANDAVTAGFDEEEFRTAGTAEYVLDPGLVEAAVDRSLAVRGIEASAAVEIEGGPEPEVVVTLSGPAEYVFAKALPGVGSSTTVTVQASASPEQAVAPLP